MQVAEIVVRFGDTLLETRSLATGAFRIGTGRDVDLAVTGLTSFPLVDWTERGCMLRVPAGLRAERIVDGITTPFEGSVVIVRGEQIAITFGKLAIHVTLGVEVAPLARRPIDTRWPRWIAGALVAHLFALFTIHALAEPEPETVRVPSVALFIAELPPPDPPPAVQARTRPRRPTKQQTPVPVQVAAIEQQPAESDPTPVRRRARAIEGARRAGILGAGITADDIRAITGTKDIEEELSDVGPVYRDYEAEQKGFGGGRRWDPTKDPRFDTVDAGRYATVSKGRAAGEQYALPGEVAARPQPRVAHCGGACTATGGLHRDAVRGAIARHDEAILGCYERAGNSQRGDVVVELTIGEDGKVITSDGAGLGTTGRCVAGVLRRVTFPKSAPTTVRYPLSFSPS